MSIFHKLCNKTLENFKLSEETQDNKIQIDQFKTCTQMIVRILSDLKYIGKNFTLKDTYFTFKLKKQNNIFIPYMHNLYSKAWLHCWNTFSANLNRWKIFAIYFLSQTSHFLGTMTLQNLWLLFYQRLM